MLFPHLIQFELFVQRQHRPVFGHTGHQEQEICETNGKENKLMSSFRKECPILLDLPTFSNLSIPLFQSETTKSTRTAAVDQQMARQTLAASALLSVVGARRVVHLRSDRAKKRSQWKEKLKLPKKEGIPVSNETEIRSNFKNSCSSTMIGPKNEL